MLKAIRKIPKNKEQTEELVFDIFQKKYDLIGEFIHGDEPDFVDKINILGIEITVIYGNEKIYGKTPKEHEVIKERIVSRACEKAETHGLQPLDLHVIFSDNIPKGK